MKSKNIFVNRIPLGSTVMVHGSATGLLAFQGKNVLEKFDNFISELLENIGPFGTILIPAFSYSAGRGEIFTLDCESRVGGFSRIALKSNKFIRTYDPMFSWLVLGYNSYKFENVVFTSAFGKNSSFELIESFNPLVLMFGVSISKGFTYIHRIEEKLAVSYRFHKTFICKANVSDQIQTIHYTYYVRQLEERYKCDLGSIEEEIVRLGIVKHIEKKLNIYSIDCNFFENYVAEQIINNKYILISNED